MNRVQPPVEGLPGDLRSFGGGGLVTSVQEEGAQGVQEIRLVSTVEVHERPECPLDEALQARVVTEQVEQPAQLNIGQFVVGLAGVGAFGGVRHLVRFREGTGDLLQVLDRGAGRDDQPLVSSHMTARLQLAHETRQGRLAVVGREQGQQSADAALAQVRDKGRHADADERSRHGLSGGTPAARHDLRQRHDVNDHRYHRPSAGRNALSGRPRMHLRKRAEAMFDYVDQGRPVRLAFQR